MTNHKTSLADVTAKGEGYLNAVWSIKTRMKTMRKVGYCIICEKPAMPRCQYCMRCHKLVNSHHREALKKRLALQKAYNKTLDAFICHYSNLPLELIDKSSPFFLEFDHRIPIPSSDLLCSGAVFNELKGDLTEDEYHIAIHQFANHWKGAPFDKKAIAFKYWSRVATLKTGPANPELLRGDKPTLFCIVCGSKPYPGSVYCPRCRRFTKWGAEPFARRLAMIASYNRIKHGFICYYTGVKLDDSDPKSPWYVSFDHAIPRKPGNLVVAAQWITIMKEDLARDEFYAVVNEQDNVFETEKVFDKDVAAFRYWNRKERQERLYHVKMPNTGRSSFGATMINSRGQRQ